MTAFWTNLFLLSLVKLGRANPGTARLALLNGLASLCAPHQILLAVVPGFYWLRTRRWKTVLTNTAVGLIAAFVIPYVLFLELFGAGFRFPDRFTTKLCFGGAPYRSGRLCHSDRADFLIALWSGP